MKRDSFLFYRDWAEALKCYPIELKCELFDAIVDFALNNVEKDDLSSTAKMIFEAFRPKLARDAEKYQSVCDKNKLNGKMGGWPKKRLGLEKPSGLNENTKNPVGFEKPNKTQKSDPNPKNPTEPDNDNDNDNDNEYKDNLSDNKLSLNSTINSAYWVIEFFNSELTKYNSIIPKIRSVSGTRLTHLKARLREYGEDAMREVITKTAQSDFMNGKSDRGWIASFDWILLPNNFPKVLEGNYDNQTTTSNSQGSIFFHTGADGRDQRAADYAQRIARLAAEDDARQAEVREP